MILALWTYDISWIRTYTAYYTRLYVHKSSHEWISFQEDELRDAVLMVLANKQDLTNAISVNIIAEAFKLHKIKHKCSMYIQLLITLFHKCSYVDIV